MNHNNIYKNNKKVWTDKPNFLIEKILNKLDKNENKNFLDLGCGQGRDSIFMLKNNFNVIGVDLSKIGIKQIKEKVKKQNLNKIKLYNKNIVDYKIKNDYFGVINIFNTLQFIYKKKAIELLKDIKNKIKNNGFILISCFTIKDNLYLKNPKNCFFEKDELKNIFSDFKIIFYEEKEINDPGHVGELKPHKHYIVNIIAQKKI